MTYKTMQRILLVCMLYFLNSNMYAQSTSEHIRNFQEETGADISLNTATEVSNFVRLPQERAMRFAGTFGERADAFLTQYGGIFGIENQNEELRVKDIERDRIGFRRYILEQHYQDVPVFDGQLQFHFNSNGDISAINGNFLPKIQLDPEPSVSQTAAALIAIETVTQQQRGVLNAPLHVHENTLYIFNKGMPQGFRSVDNLVYRVEVRNDLDVREFLFVDAHKGNIVEQYTGIACALSRRLYENNSGNQVWQEGDVLPGTLDSWQQNEVEAAGHTYHFFNNTFGIDSYDNAGAEMRTINNNPAIFCPNASWNGVTANYCTGTASDDIVAHEWGHAYTEYTNNLIYAHESGAINEAYSDIWGETIDLLNNYEDVGEDNSVRSGTLCTESNRWKIGEDATAFGGTVRDMWVPSCNNDPDFVGSADFDCDFDLSDNGGVHSNSGIPNHAYALLVDGGTYNGQTIAALGFTKAAHIFWRAQSNYLTNTSDFTVLANALEQACQDLIGIDLEGLSTTATPAGLSGEIISVADCAEVTKAILAVNLRGDNACGYTTLLQPVSAVCGSLGMPGETVFREDWEAGLGSWTVAQVPSNIGTWDARDWVLESNLPDNRAGAGVFGVNPSFGDCDTGDWDNGVIQLQSPLISVASSVTAPILMTFDHYVSLENFQDGGQVYYRINGNTWTLLPSTAFTANGYNAILQTANSNNPYAGQDAFSGANQDFPNSTWGQSQIDLSSIGLVPGDDIELRWDLSTDGCGGWDGWYLDDILIYSCTPAAGPDISFTTATSGIDEAAANISNICLDYYETTLTMQITAAPTDSINIIVTATGTATEGATEDYTFMPNIFTLDGTTMSQDITIRIYDDALIEGTETIDFAYTFNPNTGNGEAGIINQTHTLSINDDDTAPGNVTGILLLSENFDNLNLWTVLDGGSTADTWFSETAHNGTNTLDGSSFLFANSFQAGFGSITLEEIESPVMNTQGMTNMLLTFDQYFYAWSLDYEERCLVDVWDGTTWQNLLIQLGSGGDLGNWSAPDPVSILIPDAYANPNMKIRFTYDAQYDNWWAIDNVNITGDQATAVQSPVNVSVGDEQYLGPNAEVYFYDPTTGNVMARIKNLSAHDYGCTTVEVERAGTAASAAWATGTADYIADKTFQVTPTNNDPMGTYEISLYYTEAEIAGWETATGRTRADLMHIRTADDLPNPTLADTRTYAMSTTTTYGTDWIYTANYETGFADFGIGPVEPSVTVSPKVFLQGPSNGAMMNDGLRNSGLVPATEPYTTLGYTHYGGGGNESVIASRLGTTGTKAILDWVVVELRDAVTPSMITATRSALLLTDGTVVDTDGVSAVRFSGVIAGDYYVAIHHRNHLGVMTATAVTLN